MRETPRSPAGPPSIGPGIRFLGSLTDKVLRVAASVESLARRPLGQAALALLLLIYGAHASTRTMGDFKLYHQAANRLLAGEAIYRLEDPHRYLYAPVLTFLFVPLAPFPILFGKIVWFSVNLWIVFSLLRLSVTLVFPDGRAPPGFVALVLLFSLRFIDNNVGHGQINLFLTWLILEAYVLAGRGRPGLAGLALAGAIATKVVPAVLLLQIGLRRQWKLGGATVAALGLLMAAPVLWWGREYPGVLRQWVAVVMDQAGHYELGNKINQSISAFGYRLFRPYPGGMPLWELPAGLVAAFSLALHAAFLLPLVRLSARLGVERAPDPQGPSGDELSLYLIYSTVASPYSWKYYFASLVLPFAAAARRLWGPSRGRVEIGLWAVFLLNFLPGLRLFGKQAGLLFQLYSFHFLSAAVLFVMIFRALRER